MKKEKSMRIAVWHSILCESIFLFICACRWCMRCTLYYNNNNNNTMMLIIIHFWLWYWRIYKATVTGCIRARNNSRLPIYIYIIRRTIFGLKLCRVHDGEDTRETESATLQQQNVYRDSSTLFGNDYTNGQSDPS